MRGVSDNLDKNRVPLSLAFRPKVKQILNSKTIVKHLDKATTSRCKFVSVDIVMNRVYK